jgi:hypothetical protein
VLLSLLSAVGHAETIYALTATSRLVTFDSATPGTVSPEVVISGKQSGEDILAIDFRPSTGQLYGLGSTSRLYTINPTTGAATQVGSAGAFTLSNTTLDMDFNPVVDRIRVVGGTGQNIRLNPNDGTLTATDTNLAYASGDPNFGTNPIVPSAAYTNSFSGAVSTTLFGIDGNLDILVRQGSVGGTPVSPNTGQLFTIGPLGVNAAGTSGFDISGATGTAYALFNSFNFYTVNLSTGALTLVGIVGAIPAIEDIAVAPQGVTLTPTPTATATSTSSPTVTSTPQGGGAPAQVPTLSGWAMLVMGLTLAAGALLFIRGGSAPGA